MDPTAAVVRGGVSRGGFRPRGLETTRIETFTDAAFAFALTLLVITLEPPTSYAELIAALRNVPAFLLSATLLVMFWRGHSDWSRRYGLEDGMTVILSSFLIFTVLVYVYPLRFMFGAMMEWIAMMTGLPVGAAQVSIGALEEVNRMFAVYGTGFAAMCLALVLLHLHAWNRRADLDLNDFERFETLAAMGAWTVLAGTGFFSILLALTVPATWIGIPGWAYAVLPIAMPLYRKAMLRRRPPVAAREPASTAIGAPTPPAMPSLDP